MDGFTVKIEEEHEPRPIALPDVRTESQIYRVSGSNHEVFEIKVEVEEGGIKQEEGGIKQEEGGIKQEEGGIKQEEGGIKLEEGGIKLEEGGIKLEEGGIKLEEGGIKLEEGGIKLEESGIKQEESGIKQEEGGIKQEVQCVRVQEQPMPKIIAVSGGNININYEQLPPQTPQLGGQPSEKRSAAEAPENVVPASKCPKVDAGCAQEDSYDCTFCGEKFARKPRLSKHVLAAHLDELLVKCPQCEAQFGSRRELTDHQKYHSGEKLFCCNRCGQAFKYFSNYRSHIHDHMGTQPYNCGECGAGFSSRRKARLHVDTRHSMFWPYKCSLCLKPFMEKKKFLRHQKTHAVNNENGPTAAHA